MKIKIRLLIALCALLPFIGQAITVECDNYEGFTVGSYTRDYFYKVTLGATEQVDYFQVARLVDASYITDIVALNASAVPLSGWAGQCDTATEPYTGFFAHGTTIGATPLTTTPLDVEWSGSSLGEGVYWFGYNSLLPMATGGFLASGSATSLSEDWNEELGQGVGPVHIPIPEPASVLMLGLGGVLIGFFRRLYSHHA